MAKYAYYDGHKIGFSRLSKATDGNDDFTISLSSDSLVDFEYIQLHGNFVLQQEAKPVEYGAKINYSIEPRYIWKKTTYATATYDGEEYTIGDPVAQYAYYNGEPVTFGRFTFSKDIRDNFKISLYTEYVSDGCYLKLDGNFYINEDRDLF